jgi:hypothetical protein
LKVALILLHKADVVIRDRKIGLPARIAGVGFRKAFSNGEAILIGFERGLKVALILLRIAEPI